MGCLGHTGASLSCAPSRGLGLVPRDAFIVANMPIAIPIILITHVDKFCRNHSAGLS